MSSEVEADLEGVRNTENERNLKGVGGYYTAASGAETKHLIFAGTYGEITDPKREVNAMFDSYNKAAGIQVTTPPKDVTPSGATEPVLCERLTRPEGLGTVAVCAWSDHSTVAAVSCNEMGEPSSLEAFAKKTAEVRDEVRQHLDQAP
ncbi:hypothetical protein AB0K89_10780 [Streptomyces cinnamoneus]|uniref:hypothetical protein n=1 Tax=Streptomyces cinnamoneus TaxID=53446 RepID=UPI0034120FBC